MTTWTDASATSTTYDENLGGTNWDAGATEWDVSGNVVMTYWDTSSDTWTDATATATTWTDA